MKIAVSSQGQDLESSVDPRFGRARYFIIYDTETDKFEAVDNNQNVMAAQGAGVQAAQNVASYDVDMVISGNFGPKAFQVLNSAGIKASFCEGGTVSEALELAKSNKLKFANGANVEGHWM